MSFAADVAEELGDKGCMQWLVKREKRSVVYISFGSYTRITAEDMVEFLHGLVGAGFPFLWAIRPDLVKGEGAKHQAVVNSLDVGRRDFLLS
ncbi:7-deoxyloganetic acid glucosyltransferase [Nymphaea thermarum]|nr:7-deoxyloganetic acid glucosyltransferase [Nymphaea thermarum]